MYDPNFIFSIGFITGVINCAIINTIIWALEDRAKKKAMLEAKKQAALEAQKCGVYNKE